ncbi:MAG: hypothetical protein MHPSP_004332, partial [Paramarteilia canceri]
MATREEHIESIKNYFSEKWVELKSINQLKCFINCMIASSYTNLGYGFLMVLMLSLIFKTMDSEGSDGTLLSCVIEGSSFPDNREYLL